MLRNASLPDNRIANRALATLRHRLPAGWEPAFAPGGRDRSGDRDGVLSVRAPDGRTACFTVEAKSMMEPRAALVLITARRGSSPLLVIAPYLSPAVRERLRDGDVSYLDLTGNVRLTASDPGLYIETQGADQNPDREERPARTLRGGKAGRIVRLLIDSATPPGVREIAEKAGIDPGYVSRVLALLDSEALIDRDKRGRIVRVDWQPLLRRWAEDAPMESRGRLGTYLEPRGLTALQYKLATWERPYAVTGSLAASRLAPVAASRLATIWVTDAEEAARNLDLREADAGANVILAEAGDPSLLDGRKLIDIIWYAPPSLVAADLLTSPGRGPAEAEALIAWMAAHEDAWRG